ncbi:MAG: FAD-dependent oxidoreductase [Actinomycetota bacterium]|nr:FAD-dependent oxidoreductase [Actinomycetota bacterium]
MPVLSRRHFLVTASSTAAATVLGPTPAAAAARGHKVVILGGGVAGLSAAHELVERDFDVTVYERRALGGKARSTQVPGTGRDGRRDLPGEHGFRFFPGFYQNIPDTMRRIPFPGNANGVYDNLVDARVLLTARSGGRANLPFPLSLTSPPRLTPASVVEILRATVETTGRIPPHESAFFANRMLVYLTSCDERRLGQWEHTTWWDFLRAATMSEDYRRLLVIGPTRNLVATKAEVASTHTVAHMAEAFLYNALGRGNDGAMDRLLNGPTNEAWIDPWVDHLTGLGARFRVGWTAEDLEYANGRIVAALVTDPAGIGRRVEADWFVCAVPIERAVRLWNRQILAADPRLVSATRLETAWMVGLQLYLRRQTPIVPGHVNYIDSPWALTSISQAQFWPRQDFPRDFGDGTVRDCLSVDISSWDSPGILFGKPAAECTGEEVTHEVWAQLKAALEDTGDQVLPDELLHSSFLDPGVTGLDEGRPHNEDPLLTHPVGTWQKRPTAGTAIANFFLAADYVRNDLDLATMEGANEAARAAVNGILDATGSSEPRCRIATLYQPPEFEPFKTQDEINYRRGLPNVFDIAP